MERDGVTLMQTFFGCGILAKEKVWNGAMRASLFVEGVESECLIGNNNNDHNNHASTASRWEYYITEPSLNSSQVLVLFLNVSTSIPMSLSGEWNEKQADAIL